VTVSAWEVAARAFETDQVPPAFGSPLALGQHLDHRTVRTPALDLVDQALTDVIEGRCDRLILVLPPQEGKSTTTRFAALLALQRNPWLRVGVASYADRLARRIPRQCRNDILGHPELGLLVGRDQRAAYDWRLTNGFGGMYAAGIRGVWSGQPIDLLLIDDPLKGREQADSADARDAVWDWWTSTATARLSEGAPVVLITTRWHHDDLAGRFIAAGGWRVVHIPAQADPEVLDPDPLGRAAGEFMTSARGRTQESWERRQVEADDEWLPVYQGDPAAPGGEFFEMDRLRYWTLPRDAGRQVVCGQRVWRLDVDCWLFATIDTATSERQGADFTVASAWAVPVDGSLILLDLARERVAPHKQFDLARPLVERWGLKRVFVESTMAGTQLVRELVKAGFPVDDVLADKSKRLRAAPAARRVRDGQVWLPQDHPLLPTVLKELREFDRGRHDDIVDTLAYAAAVNYREWVPAQPLPVRRGPTVHDLVASRATDGAGFDPRTAAF
jgi:predicted phage terminase large subunit-like protein